MTGLRMFYPWRGNSPMDSMADTAEIRGAGLRMRIWHGAASASCWQEWIKGGHIAAPLGSKHDACEREKN